MAKFTKPNTCPLGLYRIKDLPRGEYVKRVDVCKHCGGKGWNVGANVSDTGGYAPGRTESCRACEGKGFIREYNTVWIKGDYCRSFPNAGKYSLVAFDNMNHETFRGGNVLVLAGFTF